MEKVDFKANAKLVGAVRRNLARQNVAEAVRHERLSVKQLNRLENAMRKRQQMRFVGRVGLPLQTAITAYTVARATAEGIRAYNAHTDAKANEKYMTDNYGTIEAATRTRKNKDKFKPTDVGHPKSTPGAGTR